MTNRPDERKEKKGGAMPPLAGAAGRGASLEAGGSLEGAAVNRPGLFSRFLGPGRSLATLLRDMSLGRISAAEALSKAVHSPFALGLLAGLTAISVGYGIVGTFKHLSKKGTSSVLGFPYQPSGPGVPRQKTGTGDSLGMFKDANKGGLGDALAPGLADNNAKIPEEGTPEGDSASNMMDGKGKPAADPSAMVAAMMEKAKNEGKDGKPAGPAGASSGMMMALSGGGSAGGASKSGGGEGGGTLRAMSGGSRTGMGRSGASSHGVRGQTRAMGQLKVANELSKNAVPQTGEASNYTARQAFEGNSGSGAQPLDGGQGVSTQGGGQPTGQLDGPGPKPSIGSGDIENTEAGGEEEGPQEELKGENVTPYQNYVDMAQALLKWGAILAALAWLLYQISYASFIAPAVAAGMRTLAAYLSQAAAVLAGCAALCGVAIMLFGQVEQGILYTVCGSLLAVLAWNAAEDYRSGDSWHFIKGDAAKSSAPIKYHDGPTGKFKNYC